MNSQDCSEGLSLSAIEIQTPHLKCAALISDDSFRLFRPHLKNVPQFHRKSEDFNLFTHSPLHVLLEGVVERHVHRSLVCQRYET